MLLNIQEAKILVQNQIQNLYFAPLVKNIDLLLAKIWFSALKLNFYHIPLLNNERIETEFSEIFACGFKT
jgi:hypothetical protein